jgi:hypothetical protein
MTTDEARQRAGQLRDSILGHHDLLCMMLEERKDAIIKCWTTYGRKKRLSEIANACSNLPSRLLTADMLRGRISDGNASESRHQFLLFPITKELLSTDPLALIALAHRRSTLQPEGYVAHDMKQLVMGFKQYAFPPTYAPGCIFMSGERFGHFIEHFIADEVHWKKAYPTYVALLILER